MLSIKILKLYQEIFDKTEKEIKEEVVNSGATCTKDYIGFKYDEIISRGYTISKKKYSIINKDVLIFAYHHGDSGGYYDFYTNAIQPHVGRRYCLKIKNMHVRSICLGGNEAVCTNLLNDFRLVDLRFTLEDVFSKIKESNGYWTLAAYGCKPAENLEFANCNFCKSVVIKSDFPICSSCDEQIKLNFPDKSPKSLKFCRNHGYICSKTRQCIGCQE